MAHAWLYFLKFLAVSGLAVLACSAFTAKAYSFDVHQFFETRCGQCHLHSGDVALEKLVIVNGTLRGRGSGNDILVFLPNHYGNPNPEETAALYELFLWQVRGSGIFKARCAICHIRARELARQSLLRDGDAVRGRYSGNDMAEFLLTHGRIDRGEVDFFIQMLSRLAPALKR